MLCKRGCSVILMLPLFLVSEIHKRVARESENSVGYGTKSHGSRARGVNIAPVSYNYDNHVLS